VSQTVDVCIVGAGYSGAMVAANLVRQGFPGRIALVERTGTPGPGVAYATPSELLLLNVPAKNMGAWADDPGDFVSWLGTTKRQFDPSAFLPRHWYGEYLRARLAEGVAKANGRLRLVHGSAESAARSAWGWDIGLSDGQRISAGSLVLAMGNLRPGTPPGVALRESGPWWCPDPWDAKAHRRCRDGERVLVIGTGLTMVDVCISLTSGGARPRLTVLSRNGLLPCVHSPPGLKAVAATAPQPGWPLRRMVRHVRSEARRIMREGGDWRAAVDCLRPLTPALWASLSDAEHKRFVQRLRTHWDVHRHRVPAEVVARLVELQQRRALRIVTGRLREMRGQGDSATVTWQPRGAPATEAGVFDRVINCTGARTSIDASPFLTSLAEGGFIQPERIGLGVQTDADGRAVAPGGAARRDIWVIGPLRRGTLWESTAVPELRVQAAQVARELSALLIPATHPS